MAGWAVKNVSVKEVMKPLRSVCFIFLTGFARYAVRIKLRIVTPYAQSVLKRQIISQGLIGSTKEWHGGLNTGVSASYPCV